MSEQRIVLITGSTTGLGLATATHLLTLTSPTYHVIITSRTPSRASTTATTLSLLPSTQGTVSSLSLDVTSDPSVDAAATTIATEFGRLDILINNAGVYGSIPSPPSHPQPLLRDGLRHALSVNTVGVASVTEAMKYLLMKAVGGVGKVVFVSTALASLQMAGDMESRHFGPYATEYRASKVAANMLMVQFGGNPGWKGVEFVGVDPGFLATDLAGNKEMVREMGAIEPEEGAKVVVQAVVGGEKGAGKGRVCGVDGVNAW